MHNPGFTNLEPNDEIKRYDNTKFTAHMEKAFAGVTYALLKQKNVLEHEIRGLLTSMQQPEQLNSVYIAEKLNEIFTKGEYQKVTSDIFQLVCGHRAELVQYRRESIINFVKDPYHKQLLRKIPPSCSHIFDTDKFSSLLEKAGGVKGVFWPKSKDRVHSAPQNESGPSQLSNAYGPTPKPSYTSRRDVKPCQRKYHSQYHGQGHQPFRGNRGGRGGKRYDDNRGRKAGSPSSHRDRRGHNNRKL